MSDNATLVAQAHDINLEGAESEAVAQAVVDFVAAQKQAHADAMAAAQAVIDQLTVEQLPQAQRDEITSALATAKASFDNSQRVLTAIVTPPAEPLPEPEPPVEGEGTTLNATRRRR